MASSKRRRLQSTFVARRRVEFHGILQRDLESTPKPLKYLAIYKCQRYPKTWDEVDGTLMGDILASRRSPPAFDPTACGGPRHWNDDKNRSYGYWKNRSSKQFQGVEAPDVSVIQSFLRMRPDAVGQPVLKKLGPPTAMGEGWHRLPVVAFDADACQGWERAWHGCKVEAVYSILYHGQLAESRLVPGERVLEGAPGVYTHRDCRSHKANHYIRFAPLCRDGTFWAAKWEVRANLADKVKTPRKTDQLVVRAKGVQLVALWVCGRAAADMQSGDEVNIQWNPKMEANPASEEMSMGKGAWR